MGGETEAVPWEGREASTLGRLLCEGLWSTAGPAQPRKGRAETEAAVRDSELSAGHVPATEVTAQLNHRAALPDH